MKSAVAVADEAPKVSLRKVPVVAPDNVSTDWSGHVRRGIVVRLPEGLIADDLKQNEIWGRVQRGGKSLKPHDELYMISFDQTWVADAVVSASDAKTATIVVKGIHRTPQRAKPLFKDDTYEVAWIGSGFVVNRRKDGHRMCGIQACEELAIRELKALYPTPVT